MTTPPPGIPAGSWYESATMTWYDDTGYKAYTVDESGNITATRDYTAEERTAADQRRNQAVLLQKAKAAIAANNNDITAADSIAANTSLNAAIRTLGAQSSRQAKELNALIRLVVQDFTSTDGT